MAAYDCSLYSSASSINENKNANVKFRRNGNATKIVKYGTEKKRKSKNKKRNKKVSKSF